MESEVKTKLAHDTYVKVKALSEMIPLTNRRFYELTGGFSRDEIESLDQITAGKLEDHLLAVADYYIDFKNMIHQAFETNQVEQTTNPLAVAKIFLPLAVDRISRDISEGRIMLLNKEALHVKQG